MGWRSLIWMPLTLPRAVLSISGLRRNEPPRRRKVRRNGQGTGLTSGLVVGWCGGTVVSRPAERRVYCCQCENVANASVANVQFYPQVQSPLIGNWNWQWQHFHIGNIRMDRGRVPTDANDLFRDARARAPLLHQVLQLPQNKKVILGLRPRPIWCKLSVVGKTNERNK